MCGIAGLFGAPGADRLVARMLADMEHRGPDGSGVAALSTGALGMCRLRIRGASDLALPLEARGGRILVAYNGEVYGDRSPSGGSLPEGATGEVERIVDAGDDLASHPDGMFSAAIFDGSSGIELFRDPFGIKPLFQAAIPGGHAFASEMEPLARLVPRADPPLASVAELLAFGRVLGERTFHPGIRRVAPGARVRIDRAGLRSQPFSHLPRALAGATPETLLEALAASIERCTAAQRSIGIAVSGGLDSTLLAALVNRQGLEAVTTVSVTMPGSGDGVGAPIDLGAHGPWRDWRHHVATFGASDLPEALDESVRVLGEPTRMTSMPLYLRLARAAREAGIVVLLTGEGADELFGGYDRHRAWAALDPAQRSIEAYLLPRERRRLVDLLVGSNVLDEPLARLSARWSAESSDFDAVRRSDLVVRLEPLLQRTDHALMHASIEGRTPFLHGRIPGLALGLREMDLVSPTESKRALRAAAALLLSCSAAGAPKQPFRMPLAQWLAGPLRAWALDRLAAGRSDLEGLGLRSPGIAAVTEGALRGEREAVQMLFVLLTLVSWCEGPRARPGGLGSTG